MSRIQATGGVVNHLHKHRSTRRKRHMRRRPQCPKPPVGLLAARSEALTLDEATHPYVRRRLERLRFNLDAASPWVAASIGDAREKDKAWLVDVASGIVSTSQKVSDLMRTKAYDSADWPRHARQVLAAIDGMLFSYTEAAEDGHWGYVDEEPGGVRTA